MSFNDEFQKFKDDTKPMCDLMGCPELVDDFIVNIELSRQSFKSFYEVGAASRQAEIGEIIQNLIKRADEKASEPHIRDTKYAYFQGMAEGLSTLLHSIGLDDDCDKVPKGKEND